MIPGNINSLLLAADAAGGYNISRSLRFNSPDSAYLSRTPASAGNRKTWTWAGWVKRSALAPATGLFAAGSNGSNISVIYLPTSGAIQYYDYVGASFTTSIATTAVYRDFSAWMHVVVAADTTQGTPADRIRIYVNGVKVTAFSTATYPSQSADTFINSATTHTINKESDFYANHGNGYLADVHFIDGGTPQTDIDSDGSVTGIVGAEYLLDFGEFDADTGVWNPKAYTGSYNVGAGAFNGFHLDFADNSTAAALGTDSAGSNDWTVNNISVTAGAGNDSLVDVPTNGTETDTGVGGEVRGNYCTMNPLDPASGVPLSLTNGNLEHTNPSTAWKWSRGTFAMTTGKWYWEQTVSAGATGSEGYLAGVATASFNFNASTVGLYARQSNAKYDNGTTSQPFFSNTTAGDILGFAFDADAGKLWVSQNGTFIGSPTAGTGNSWSSVPTGVFPLFAAYNVTGNIMNFGQRAFAYTAPSGFKALCTANLPAPLVTKPSTVMDVLAYSGSGSSRTFTGFGFGPDLVWIKRRSEATNHRLYDAVRGATKALYSNLTNSEGTDSTGLTSFTSDGFTLGDGDVVWNASGQTYVAWTWDAGETTDNNNQDGSITGGAQVRVNATAGFSVVTWTSDGSSSIQTMGTGLNATPGLIIAKNRSISGNWWVWHSSFSNQVRDYLLLQTTDAKVTAGVDVWSTSSTTFGIRQATIANNTNQCVAYVFSPVDGYSNGFSYTGNGSTDGSFVYLGFRPRLILLKCSSTTGNWTLVDTAREGYNVDNDPLYPNLSDAEGTTDLLDITSNGFKLRTTDASVNSNAATYIGFAWAESPFNYSRAR